MSTELWESMEKEIALLREYKKVLKEYSRNVNVISKKITASQLDDLLRESVLVEKMIRENSVVDAGSGNGLLGIPVAVLNPQKRVYLVEPRKKKSEFLVFLKEELKINNIEIIRADIGWFIKNKNIHNAAITARGFPDNEKLISYVKKRVVRAVFLITSMNKIKKIKKGIEKVEQKIYNIPFRDNLKIVSIINVSRETQGENG